MKQYKINTITVNIEVATDYGLEMRDGSFKTAEEAKAWIDDQIADMDQRDIILDECQCRKCGNKLQCEHKENEPHEQSICGVCAG